MTKEQILNPKNNFSTIEKIVKLNKLYKALERQLELLKEPEEVKEEEKKEEEAPEEQVVKRKRGRPRKDEKKN